MKKIDENFFKTNTMTYNSIEDLLENDEQILWRGKPKRSAFIWSQILQMLPFAIIWLILDGAVIFGFIFSGVDIPWWGIVFICIFFAFHLLPVWIWLSNALLASKRHKNLDYAFTNKRIIVRKDVVIDFVSIYYADIQAVNIKVGLVDRMFKVGDIYITSSGKSVVLEDLDNPYIIGNKLQGLSHDIKTDIYYPNAFRPEDNPGYNTKYNKEEK